jgi:hypothetical protein
MKWGSESTKLKFFRIIHKKREKKLWYFQILIVILQQIRVTKIKEDYNMTKIMSNSKERLNDKAQRFFEDSSTVQEPMVAYRHDYATEAHNEFEEYPFMTSCNNDELANHVLAREEEYARTGNAVDFLEMMADFKNEFEW